MMAVIIFVLFVYGFFQLLKFFVYQNVSDIKSHITDDWMSDERDHRNNKSLLMFAKFLGSVAFACVLFNAFF